MSFFDINNIAIQILNYSISYVEVIGTIFGFFSVYFASKTNILTWGTGLVNVVFLFILFFQVQLYADMFLQIFFFVTTIYGWYNWQSKSEIIKITSINKKNYVKYLFIIIFTTLVSGYLLSNIHSYLPNYFKIKASFPYIDSFVMVCSIIATIFLAKKKLENWYLWIVIDLVSCILYFKKQTYFLSLEYLIFLGIASYGLYNWQKKLKYD